MLGWKSLLEVGLVPFPTNIAFLRVYIKGTCTIPDLTKSLISQNCIFLLTVTHKVICSFLVLSTLLVSLLPLDQTFQYSSPQVYTACLWG